MLASAFIALCAAGGAPCVAEALGLTGPQIGIARVVPLSGPASPMQLVGKAFSACVQILDDRGSVSDHKIDYIALAVTQSPSEATERIHRLVRCDQVSFGYDQLGSPDGSGAREYLNSRNIPGLSMIGGLRKLANVQGHPLTSTFAGLESQGKINAKALVEALPKATVAIPYQDDD
jgi:ABC-type branched-subunit amino acid transport system substrate-binding protein